MGSSWGPLRLASGVTCSYTFMGIPSPIFSSILSVPNLELRLRGSREEISGLPMQERISRNKEVLSHSRTVRAAVFSELGLKQASLLPGDRRIKPRPACGQAWGPGLRPGRSPGCLGGGGKLRGSGCALSLQYLHACDPRMAIQWQVVDRRIPLSTTHKTILQKAAALYGAYY